MIGTLQFLAKAGFPDPMLFVDDCTPAMAVFYQDQTHLRVSGRHPAIGVHGNWVLGIYELYLRQPKADRYAMFQDDIVLSRNLRGYLERTAWPGDGYLNLYTFPENQQRARGNGFFEANQRGLGAVALVFDNKAVRYLLSHKHMVERVQGERYPKWLDGGIVESFRAAGWREFCHNPSLVQHVGDKSSIGNAPQAKAPSFRGEDFDCLELLR